MLKKLLIGSAVLAMALSMIAAAPLSVAPKYTPPPPSVTFIKDATGFKFSSGWAYRVDSWIANFCSGGSVSENEHDAWFGYELLGGQISQVSLTADSFFKRGKDVVFLYTPSMACPAPALAPAWLLVDTKDSPATTCVIIAPLNGPQPSVDVQKLVCYPKTNPNWVADYAPCKGWIMASGYWACTALMKSYEPEAVLLPLSQIHQVWKDMRSTGQFKGLS